VTLVGPPVTVTLVTVTVARRPSLPAQAVDGLQELLLIQIDTGDLNIDSWPLDPGQRDHLHFVPRALGSLRREEFENP
jgi:hypothetical protein